MSKRTLLKFFFALACFSLLTIFLIFNYGFSTGLHTAFLVWSLYILCIPAAHGMTIFGTLIRFVRHKPFFTHPYVWIAAFLLNAFSWTFTPMVYATTFSTHLLYRLIERPACWTIFIISALGTMYPVLIGNEKFYKNFYFHALIHHIIKIIGLFTFIYFAHPELIIIINTMS